MKAITASVLLCLLAVATLSAQNPMRPGRWEVGMEMQMAGMQMPQMKNTQCITDDDLKKDPTTGLPNGAQNADRNACKVSDYKATGNKVSWKMACTGQQALTGEGELTFGADTYTGTLKMVMPQGAMTMKLDGKRLGDCTK